MCPERRADAYSTILLLSISPLLLTIMVLGVAVTIALARANPEDVPTVLKEALGVIRRVAIRISGQAPASDSSLESGDSTRATEDTEPFRVTVCRVM